MKPMTMQTCSVPPESQVFLATPESQLLAALAALIEPTGSRRRVFLDGVLATVFERARRSPIAARPYQLCYSVKTNPRSEVLQCARAHGFFAEVISPQEVSHAIACGFEASQIVYNGPYPATYCRVAPGYVFADSPEAFAAAATRFTESTIGIRLRPDGIDSHFGIPHSALPRIVRTIRSCGLTKIGVSFHVRPQDYRAYTWRTLVDALLELAQKLEAESGAKVTVFDAGGGKQPHEIDEAISAGDFDWLRERAASRLPSLQKVFLEPGQGLVTGCEAVISAILEVRQRDGVRDVVVDAGYPDVSQMSTFEHRLFHAANGAIRPIRRGIGAGRIIGRTCLEYDVLASSLDLSQCVAGDAIVIADAGAYDASMAFAFSEGARRDTLHP